MFSHSRAASRAAGSAIAVICSAAVGSGALVLGAGTAAAQETPPGPAILGVELDEEDGRPTVEIDYVNLQGERREIDVDLQTGLITEDEPDDEATAPASTLPG
ncbi:PepSY domain-containing protein [Prescottella equi]|uniref:PepSY domain-containing protein n=1 Tax=Rhodococcus hoagii TaxID=43767 RepID=UPI000A0FB0AB|nr:peptidase [Prescottella equi]NKR90883.1 peptidase [Prescottella equi]ORJ93584.1 peptidase [Prescottella equi]